MPLGNGQADDVAESLQDNPMAVKFNPAVQRPAYEPSEGEKSEPQILKICANVARAWLLEHHTHVYELYSRAENSSKGLFGQPMDPPTLSQLDPWCHDLLIDAKVICDILWSRARIASSDVELATDPHMTVRKMVTIAEGIDKVAYPLRILEVIPSSKRGIDNWIRWYRWAMDVCEELGNNEAAEEIKALGKKGWE